MSAQHSVALDALARRRNELTRKVREHQQELAQLEDTIRLLTGGSVPKSEDGEKPYSEMGVTEAVVCYLKTHPGQHRSKEISAALQVLGVKTSSKNLERLTDNLLRRLVSEKRHGVCSVKAPSGRVHFFIKPDEQKEPAGDQAPAGLGTLVGAHSAG